MTHDGHSGDPDINASWDAIVAALEEDVRRTEAEALARSRPDDVPDAVAPSQSRLPDLGAAQPAMPAPDTMPAVPPEVAERIRALQGRIDVLTRQLQDELAALRPVAFNSSRNRLTSAFEQPSRPRFFDGKA